MFLVLRIPPAGLLSRALRRKDLKRRWTIRQQVGRNASYPRKAAWTPRTVLLSKVRLLPPLLRRTHQTLNKTAQFNNEPKTSAGKMPGAPGFFNPDLTLKEFFS